MKIRIISLICLISVLLFACWAGNKSLKVNNDETSNEKLDTDNHSEGVMSSMELPGWNTFKGNCVITDGEKLPYLEEFVIEGDVLTFYGDDYTVGQEITVVMNDQHTSSIYDDTIINVK